MRLVCHNTTGVCIGRARGQAWVALRPTTRVAHEDESIMMGRRPTAGSLASIATNSSMAYRGPQHKQAGPAEWIVSGGAATVRVPGKRYAPGERSNNGLGASGKGGGIRTCLLRVDEGIIEVNIDDVAALLDLTARNPESLHGRAAARK